ERLAQLTDRDRDLNSFAFRSFRDVADADYIAARMAYRALLPVQFLWARRKTKWRCPLFPRLLASWPKYDLNDSVATMIAAPSRTRPIRLRSGQIRPRTTFRRGSNA